MVSGRLLAAFNATMPTLKDNGDLICKDQELDASRLAMFFFVNGKGIATAFPKGLADFQSALQDPDPKKWNDKQLEIVNSITTDVDLTITLPKSGFHAVSDTKPIPSFYSDKPSDLKVYCNQNNDNSLPQTVKVAQTQIISFDNIRVRGTPDALLVNSKDQAFKSSSSATLSLSENIQQHTTTNAIQAGVGYDIPFEQEDRRSYFEVIPFVAVDRNVSSTSGKQSSSSRENIMLGTTVSFTNLFSGPRGGSSANTLSATYEHIWNNINSSQLEFIHFVEAPIINPPIGNIPGINSYTFYPENASLDESWFAASAIFDLRCDLGFYSTQALQKSTTPDYQQLGTNFGIAFSIPKIKSDITVTKIYMGQLSSSVKNINLFNAEWIYNATPNFGIKGSYQNGNLETTFQQIDQWLLSLSLKL